MSSTPHARSLRAALLISSAALLLPSVGLTQEATDTEDGDLRQEAVTVYGTSNPIPVFDYPGQVAVVSRDDLDTFAPSAISDALRDVPGLEFAGGPRRTGEVPSLRGLSGQNVLILLDGARQSFTSAHDGRFFLDPDLIGTAEVVKGPASALYGSGAVGGVLAFESVDAADLLRDDETWGVRLRAAYQDVNEETFGSVTAFTRTDRFDGLASFGLRQSSDIELGSGAALPSDDEIGTALVKGSYALTNEFSLEGSWQRFTNSAVEPNNGQGTLGLGDGTLDQDVEKDITTDTFRLAANFNPIGNDWIDATVTGYSTTSEVEEFDATIPRNITREIETTGISARNSGRFTLAGIENTVTFGGDWYRDEQTGRDDQTTDGTRGGVPNAESEFTGLFLQLETVIDTPAGEFLIIPGIRYDEFESSSDTAPGQDNSDDAVSPRFAVSYGPTEWLRVYGSYSEGFRAPSINELYLDGVHFPVPHPVLFNPMMGQFVFVNNNFIANPDLTSEETETIEFGAGLDFASVITQDDRFQAKLTRYESDVSDLIDLSVDFAFDPTCFAPPFFLPCSAGTSRSANVADAEIEGWEAELRYDSKRFFAQASYATIDGENKADGSDLGTLTPDRLALNLGVNLPEWDARVGTRVQIAEDFERRQAAAGGGFEIIDQRDGYTVVDLYASWSPDFAQGLRFDVGVDNVFDEDYERVFEGVSEPARNVRIAASYQFGG